MMPYNDNVFLTESDEKFDIEKFVSDQVERIPENELERKKPECVENLQINDSESRIPDPLSLADCQKTENKVHSKTKMIKSNGPKKLYECQKFTDPVLEKQRQNAISAKLRRDKKKQEIEDLRGKVKLLKEENVRLKKVEKEVAAILAETEAKVGSNLYEVYFRLGLHKYQ